MGRVKFGVIFRLNATIILLFTHTEGTRRLRCSCTFGTDGTHKLRCSCTLVPAVHGAPWYRPPPRTSGTGTGAPRLPARWYTVRTRTVCAVEEKKTLEKLMYWRCIAAIHQEKRYIKLLMYRDVSHFLIWKYDSLF